MGYYKYYRYNRLFHDNPKKMKSNVRKIYMRDWEIVIIFAFAFIGLIFTLKQIFNF